MTGREAIERVVEEHLSEALPEVDLLEVAVMGRGASATVRTVIDHPDGVDHELCARVTKVLQHAGVLDRYGVEVWSPGPERPLRTLDHFRRAVGRRVRLKLDEAEAGGRKSHTGTLLAAEPDRVTLAGDAGVIEIPMSAVRRARMSRSET